MTKNRRAKKDARAAKGESGDPYVVARRETLLPVVPKRIVGRMFMDDMCANCLKPIPERLEGLFCSETCQETAKDVRYFRRVFRDGRIEDPNVQAAVRTRVAFLAVGGYSRLDRTLRPAIRESVRARDGGACQMCGRAGGEVDHISGSSDALSNLQLLCVDCHRAKTKANMTEASPEFQATMKEFFETRVEPEIPKLLADDQDAWESSWRALKSARRARFRDALENLGMDLTGLQTWTEWYDAGCDWVSDTDDDGYVGTEDYDGGYGPDSYFANAMAKDD